MRYGCNIWNFQIESGLVENTGNEVPPMSSKVEIRMLFQDPDMDHSLVVVAGALFHLQGVRIFSKIDIEEGM